MVISQDLKKALKKKDFISGDKELSKLIALAASQKQDLEQVIADKKNVDVDDVYKVFARILGKGKRYKNFQGDREQEKLGKKPPEALQDALPFSEQFALFEPNKKKGTVRVATRQPLDSGTESFIKDVTGLDPNPVYTSSEDFELLHDWHFNDLDNRLLALTGAPIDATSSTGFVELHRGAHSNEVESVARVLLLYGLRKMASDIHLEESEAQVLVRFRIDGVMHDVARLPKTAAPLLFAYLKKLAGLPVGSGKYSSSTKTSGHFRISIGEEIIHTRISAFPYVAGEKLVIHILPRSKNLLTFEQLGMLPRASRLVRKQLERTHGFVIVAGPPEVGKKTTLYTLLNISNTSGVNISTIESPVTHNLPGYNQVQLDDISNGAVASTLKQMLLQDSDIIMLGMQPDEKALDAAAQAAMTGHRLYFPVTAGSAVSALYELMKEGMEDYLVAATTNLIIAQRLTRKICQQCKTSTEITDEQMASLEEADVLSELIEILKQSGELGAKQTLEDLVFFHGAGCEECSRTGYDGRVGVFEVLEIDRKHAVHIAAEISEKEMERRVRKEGMQTLLEDAICSSVISVDVLHCWQIFLVNR